MLISYNQLSTVNKQKTEIVDLRKQLTKSTTKLTAVDKELNGVKKQMIKRRNSRALPPSRPFRAIYQERLC